MSPLVREEHPCWVPTCDFCNEGDGEDGSSFHYATETEAREAVEGVDWRRIRLRSRYARTIPGHRLVSDEAGR